MTARKVKDVPVTKLIGNRTKAIGLVNHIALVVDNSGSMQCVRDSARKAINDQIATIRDHTRDTGQKTSVSVYLFDSHTRPVHRGAEPKFVPELTYSDYPANGPSTALNDAVRHAITDLKAVRDADKPNVSFLVVTVTDGIENSSRGGPVDGLIREVQATDRWTLAFLAPPGGARQLESIGIPAGNIREWERTDEGVREASFVTNQAIGGYYGLRSAGLTSTKSLYTNLGNVSQAAVAAIPDVTNDFKRMKVEKESEIAPFVLAKGYRYELGRAYYELTKTEKIADHKNIAIMDRGTNRIHGGAEARKLLGITSGPGVLCKVTPGNHANYRIFVSSTSTNRKLVRGTELLYKVR